MSTSENDTVISDQQRQSSMTPDAVLDELMAGNRRFREGRGTTRDLLEQVNATRGGQWPLAAVVGCIDSRVPPEIVFDQGVGDVFSARVAGNFVNGDILGSLEFACKVAGSKLVLVLGHTHCGAIKGACDGVRLGNLSGLIEQLEPAVADITEPADADARNSGNPGFVQAVARRNVERTVADIRSRSSVLAELEQAGEIRIVGGMYDVETGSVELTAGA